MILPEDHKEALIIRNIQLENLINPRPLEAELTRAHPHRPFLNPLHDKISGLTENELEQITTILQKCHDRIQRILKIAAGPRVPWFGSRKNAFFEHTASIDDPQKGALPIQFRRDLNGLLLPDWQISPFPIPAQPVTELIQQYKNQIPTKVWHREIEQSCLTTYREEQITNDVLQLAEQLSAQISLLLLGSLHPDTAFHLTNPNHLKPLKEKLRLMR